MVQFSGIKVILQFSGLCIQILMIEIILQVARIKITLPVNVLIVRLEARLPSVLVVRLVARLPSVPLRLDLQAVIRHLSVIKVLCLMGVLQGQKIPLNQGLLQIRGIRGVLQAVIRLAF